MWWGRQGRAFWEQSRRRLPAGWSAGVEIAPVVALRPDAQRRPGCPGARGHPAPASRRLDCLRRGWPTGNRSRRGTVCATELRRNQRGTGGPHFRFSTDPVTLFTEAAPTRGHVRKPLLPLPSVVAAVDAPLVIAGDDANMARPAARTAASPQTDPATQTLSVDERPFAPW